MLFLWLTHRLVCFLFRSRARQRQEASQPNMPQPSQHSCYGDPGKSTQGTGNSSSRCQSLTPKEAASEKADWGTAAWRHWEGSVDSMSNSSARTQEMPLGVAEL